MKFDENIKIKEHFQVPEGYFEQFNADIMDKLPAKRIVMWPRYAAAAAVACLFAVSAFTYFYTGNADTPVIQHVAKNAPAKTLTPAVAKTEPSASAKNLVAKSVTQRTYEAPTVNKEPTTEEPKTVHAATTKTHNGYASYASYDQNEVDRAAQYMGIDNQDVQEMLYTNF